MQIPFNIKIRSWTTNAIDEEWNVEWTSGDRVKSKIVEALFLMRRIFQCNGVDVDRNICKPFVFH